MQSILKPIPLLIVLVFSPSAGSAAEPLPARCLHAIAAATSTFGELVADQTTKLDAKSQIRSTEAALSLAEKLRCPREKTLISIDCIVKYVHTNNKAPDVSSVVDCLKRSTGQVLHPKD